MFLRCIYTVVKSSIVSSGIMKRVWKFNNLKNSLLNKDNSLITTNDIHNLLDTIIDDTDKFSFMVDEENFIACLSEN